MKIINGINNLFSFIEKTIVVLFLSIMIVLAFAQVIMRNFFDTGLLWADPFLRHMVLWIGFLGASLATQQEKHINIDLVTRFFSPRNTNFVRIATNLFAAAVCFGLAKAGWTFLQSEIETGDILLTIGQKEFPAWWFQVIIPFGFGLMSFRFLLRTIEHIIRIFDKSLPAPHSTNVPTIEA